MNLPAQNAALKTLEEPPGYAAFILCAENERELLPTVRSRCVTISPGGEEKRTENTEAEEYIRLAAQGDGEELCRFVVSCEAISAERFAKFVCAVRQC